MTEKQHPAEAVAEKTRRLDKDGLSAILIVTHISSSGVHTPLVKSAVIPSGELKELQREIDLSLDLQTNDPISIRTSCGMVYIPQGLIQQCKFEVVQV